MPSRRGSARVALAAVVAVGLVAAAPPAAAVRPDDSSSLRRLIVSLDSPSPAAGVVGVVDVVEAAGGRVVEHLDSLDRVVVEVPESAVGRVTNRVGAASVRPDATFRTAVTPDDPRYPQQWGLPHIGAPTAWESTMGASRTTIAVLDTGVDRNHADLAGAVLPGIDIVNDDADASDDNSHGTAVAGVAAARAGNGIGIAGLCSICSILPVKVLDNEGFGFESDIAEGIVWAADNGADVINLSIASVGDGSSGSFTAMAEAIDYARGKGITVVAAAGNEGSGIPTYPAAATGVIGVGATDESDSTYDWSNFGLWVDVTAPGCTVSTVPGGYAGVCGTSFAAPLAAALVALGRTADETAGPSAAESAVTDTAVGGGVTSLHGRIQATAALAALAPGVGRAAGDSRIGTAIAVAQHAYPVGAPTVVVATAGGYADALAAAPLAQGRGGPILLVGAGGLTPDLVAEVRRLGAGSAIVVGGQAAIPTSVETQLRSAGVATVERIAGSNRFDTARRIAEAVGSSAVFVTEGAHPDPGRGWPDAVAVSGYAAQLGRPILLVRRDSLPAETAAALVAIGATSATVVGGTASVSDAVAAALTDPDGDGTPQVQVNRLSGASRYETSAAVADAALAAGASLDRLWFATGANWPDALAAGPAVAAQGGVLLLVNGGDFSQSATTSSWLESHSGYEWSRIAGGPAAVSDSTASALASQTGS